MSVNPQIARKIMAEQFDMPSRTLNNIRNLRQLEESILYRAMGGDSFYIQYCEIDMYCKSILAARGFKIESVDKHKVKISW